MCHTLCSCDRSGRGDESPEGSTASRAYQRAACHTPEREEKNTRIRTGMHTEGKGSQRSRLTIS